MPRQYLSSEAKPIESDGVGGSRGILPVDNALTHPPPWQLYLDDSTGPDDLDQAERDFLAGDAHALDVLRRA